MRVKWSPTARKIQSGRENCFAEVEPGAYFQGSGYIKMSEYYYIICAFNDISLYTSTLYAIIKKTSPVFYKSVIIEFNEFKFLQINSGFLMSHQVINFTRSRRLEDCT